MCIVLLAKLDHLVNVSKLGSDVVHRLFDDVVDCFVL